MKRTLTGGGVVVGPNKMILIVSQHGTSWSLPKGHVDKDEDLLQAAVREIEEESGITQLDFIKELGEYKRHRIGLQGGEDKSELKSITIFLFTTKQTDLNPLDKDNPEARWVELDKVTDLLTHPKDKEFFKSIGKQIGDFINV